MSDPYNNQPWSNFQAPYGHARPQLDQELEFSAHPGASDTRHLQSQSHPSEFSDSYQYSHPQYSTTSITPSSTMSASFAPSRQTSQTSDSSYTGSGQTQSSPMNGTFAHGIYASNSSQPQNSPIFNPYLDQSVSDRRTHSYHSNSQSFDYQTTIAPDPLHESSALSPSNNGTTTPYLASSPAPMQETFSSPTHLRQSHYQPSASGSLPKAKRQRNQGYLDVDNKDEEHEVDMSPDAKEGTKAKPPGACARCKNLKVKCEFKTDTDPCKRCLNGGHDCVIPGRKKRRTPPKREHLLNQIREQAEEIRKLMAKLDDSSNMSLHSGASDTFSPSPRVQSPVQSPSSVTHSYYNPDDPISGGNLSPETNKAVEDWIAKAKESFAAFGGFIGAGMPKSYFLKGDLEGSTSSDEDDYVEVEDPDGLTGDRDEYEFAVERPDGEDMVTIEISGRAELRHKTSASSLSTNATGTTGRLNRKKLTVESEKPAILPGEAVPFGLFGKMSLQQNRTRVNNGEKEDDATPGIASGGFFKSTPAPETGSNRLNNFRQQAPQILTKGIITPQEAEKLFNIYFERMNVSVSLLDPVLYTAGRTFYRSPFLFTVICAIASRFYSERPELYAQAMNCAQLAAGTALTSGQKNVELCQAYILLSLYPVPAKRWEDQRSWLYLGLAIRVATDLNLHLPNTAKPVNENHAREMLNRTRVWLNCFNLDRSTGSQYGKPPIISSSDYMANHSEHWWESSPYNMKHFDIHLSAYNAELKVMAGFVAKIYSDPHHPTGLNKEVDFERIATETDDELKLLGEKWFSRLEQTDQTVLQNSFRTGLLRLAFSYSRLVALSYGFQHAFGKNNTNENPFLLRCLTAATDVVNAVVDDICRQSQLQYWRHGPEAQSVFVTFAAAFLVKLLQPKFASYLTPEKRLEIRRLVQKVIDLLASPEIAIDDRHGPKLYSRFLKNLLATPMARVDPLSPLGLASSSPPPRQRSRRPKSASGQTPEPALDSTSSRTSTTDSPAARSSLSPPPTQSALSFDTFAPLEGAIDPFASISASVTNSINIGTSEETMNGINMSEFFQPPLPFDDDILQSMQSLSDPSGWQDVHLPGLNWMTQFQENIGLRSVGTDTAMYDPNTTQYLPV